MPDARAPWLESVFRWSRGSWSAVLADAGASNGDIGDIRYDGRSVLRAIRVVVRDRDWNDRPLRLTPTSATSSTGSSTGSMGTDAVEWDVHTTDDGTALAGRVRLSVAASTFRVELTLEAQEDAWINRAGLVVLHPAHLSGSELRVAHPDGTREATVFPRGIAPQQAAYNIQALRWDAGADHLTLSFEGDVFEMEDQRNWTDASFKTYNRPLSLPFPFLVERGETIRQSVTLTVGRTGASVRPGERTAPAGSSTIVVTLAEGGPFPEIALGASTAVGMTPKAARGRPFGIVVELDLATANWRAALGRACDSGQPLDIWFLLSDDDPGLLRDAVAALRGLRVMRVTAFRPTGPARHVSDAAAIDALRAELTHSQLDIPVVGGARSHFTELNREYHRLPADLDGIIFALTPGFHDRSHQQLIESLQIQRLVAQAAVTLAAGTPVHVGPITLRPRYNDVATEPPPRPANPTLDAGYGPQLIDASDPRQEAPELAAWTLASAAALSVAGVAGLTYFEEWGPRGICSNTGEPYSVEVILLRLAALSGSRRVYGDSSDGLVWALGGVRDSLETVLVANLDTRDRSVELHSPRGISRLDVAAGSWAVID